MADPAAVEVVDAELVDEDENRALPALADTPAHRPLIGRHTLLRPNAPVPTTADRPAYTEADFRISQETADLIDGAPPANTSRTYGSALGQFTTWCAEVNNTTSSRPAASSRMLASSGLLSSGNAQS